MADKFKVKKGINVQPVSGSTVSEKGDIAYNSSTDKVELYNGSADPVVTEAKAATLTNKTLSGNTAATLISGSGTLTLNTTGTVTVPNATDTLVGKATTDVLTNKSISGSTNTITNVSLSTGVTGTLPIGNGGTGQTGATAAFNALSPLTTKGDIVVHNGTNVVRQGVGTNGQVLVADSSQTNGVKFANAPQGLKNYITVNADLEQGATTGFTLGTATLDATTKTPSGAPTFGSGASGNLSLSLISSSQLAGTYSLGYVSSAATTAGNFVATDAFTVDLEGQAKVLQYKVAYSAVSNPSNGNFSGTSSNSFGVAIYDVTNSAWIQPAGVFNIVQNAGVGFATGTFQTSSNGTSYRLVFFNANATAGAITMYLDDFFVGPQIAAVGAIPKASTVQKFTSGSGTYTLPSNPAPYAIRVRLVGAGAGGSGGGSGGGAGTSGGNTTFGSSLLSGSGGGASAGGTQNGGLGGSASLGTGPVGTAVTGGTGGSAVVTTGAVGGTSAGTPFGAGQGGNLGSPAGNIANTGVGGAGGGAGSGGAGGGAGGSGGYVDAIISNPSATYAYAVGAAGSAGAAGTGGGTGQAGSAGYIEVEEMYYGNNVVMSSDTDTRVVAAQLGLVTNYAVSANAPIKFDTVTNDTHAGYSASTGLYTVSVPGYYRLSFTGLVTSSTSGPYVAKNGVAQSNLCSVSSTVYGAGASTVKCVAGDTLGIYSSAAVTFFGGTAPAFNTHVSIERISGPATIAATESVNARYNLTSSFSSTSGTGYILNFANKEYDSHGAVTTGASWKFTAPISGVYRLTSMCDWGGVTGGSRRIELYVNGVNYARLSYTGVNSAAYGFMTQGTTTIKLTAGQYIDVRATQDSGSPVTLGGDGALSNWVCVERVGN